MSNRGGGGNVGRREDDINLSLDDLRIADYAGNKENAVPLPPKPIRQTKKTRLADADFYHPSSSSNSRKQKHATKKQRKTREQHSRHARAAAPAEDFAPTQWSIDDFWIGKKLGKGKFGSIYRAKEKKNGLVCAIKVMHKKQLAGTSNQAQLQREVDIQLNMRHPNILRLYGYFQDATKIFLILEYAPGGEVYKKLETLERFDEKTASIYVASVARALQHAHTKNTLHRDIKPENLLIGMYGIIKLADFGWSVHAPPDARRTTMCGTLDYLPPEMLTKKNHNHGVDIWCLGVLTYEFLVGTAPFYDEDQEGTKHRIVKDKPDLRTPKACKYLTGLSRDFITRILVKDARKRMSIKSILEHPFITQYENDAVEYSDDETHHVEQWNNSIAEFEEDFPQTPSPPPPPPLSHTARAGGAEEPPPPAPSARSVAHHSHVLSSSELSASGARDHSQTDSNSNSSARPEKELDEGSGSRFAHPAQPGARVHTYAVPPKKAAAKEPLGESSNSRPQHARGPSDASTELSELSDSSGIEDMVDTPRKPGDMGLDDPPSTLRKVGKYLYDRLLGSPAIEQPHFDDAE